MSLIFGLEYEQSLQKLRDNEVLLSGHFVLSSGRHSDKYLDKRRFIEKMEDEFDRYCRLIAESIYERGYPTILAPEHAGVLVAVKVLDHLNKLGSGVELVIAHKVGENKFEIDPIEKKRLAGRCVAVIEDVITTGETAKIVGYLAREMGASFNSIYSLFDRREFGRIAGVEVHPVMRVVLDNWESPCRLCLNGVPISPKPMGSLITLPNQ